MTSANVTEFTIYNKEGYKVGDHREHAMCKSKLSELLEFEPLEDYTILPWGYDEEEEYWEGEQMNLKDFLIKCNIIKA